MTEKSLYLYSPLSNLEVTLTSRSKHFRNWIFMSINLTLDLKQLCFREFLSSLPSIDIEISYKSLSQLRSSLWVTFHKCLDNPNSHIDIYLLSGGYDL